MITGSIKSTMITIRIGLLVTLYIFAGYSSAALVPPFFVNAVVSLGRNDVVQEPNKPAAQKWVTEGTGFFYGYLVKDDPDIAKRKYAVFLITAKHVVKDHIEAKRPINARMDALEKTAKSQDFAIPNSDWFYHSREEVDLAAAPISVDFLKTHGLQSAFFASDENALTKKQMEDAGTSAGDGIFVLGFPMGLTGQQRNYVIVRQGAIARISEFLEGAAPSFLVDAFAFPGNSGGPVILKPEISAIDGTKANSKASLIGVIRQFESYVDTAYSLQTRRPRVTFEENSGLAEVLPVDLVNEMVKTKAEHLFEATEKAMAPQTLINPSPPPVLNPISPPPINMPGINQIR